MMRQALRFLGEHSENTIMVGDNMLTDVRVGLESGLETILVLTGVTTLDMVEQHPYRPTRIVESVADLRKLTTIKIHVSDLPLIPTLVGLTTVTPHPPGLPSRQLALPLNPVSSGFTSTTTAPFRNTVKGKDAAGSTTPDVPMEKNTSHVSAARNASSSAPCGSISPNHTTSGRKYEPQRGQRGGT